MKTIPILFFIIASLFLVSILFQFNSIRNEMRRVLPQLEEELISVQTVKINGEIYICGTSREEDRESLYCSGYRDGYNWAVKQVEMDRIINKALE